MKDRIAPAALLAALVPALAAFAGPNPNFKPTAQDAIVPKGAEVEWLWNEGEFTEGPTLALDGAILFSDIGNRIMRYDPATGITTVFRADSGKTNGLMFNQKGQLVACEGAAGGGRRISIIDPDPQGPPGKLMPEARTLTDKWDGKRYNSPNDLAIDPHGNVYFTDPRYDGDEPREIDFEGVFLVTPAGKVALATRDLQKPNGILVSIDGTTVYVADNNPKGNRHLVAFTPKADGTLTGKKLLFDFGDKARGIDGMTLDVEGNLYATAGEGEQSGIYVFGPAGEHLAFIQLDTAPTNCVFGGGDHAKVLYITAPGRKHPSQPEGRYALYRVKLRKQGFHIYPDKVVTPQPRR
jgi:sugar lactone lactonase YvrE